MREKQSKEKEWDEKTLVGGSDDESEPSQKQEPTNNNQANTQSNKKDDKPKGSFWSRCKDKWAFVIFLLFFAIYTGLSSWCIPYMVINYEDVTNIDAPGNWDVSVSKGNGNNVQFKQAFDKETGVELAGGTLIAIGMSFGLLFFVRQWPNVVIRMGPIFAIVFLAAGSAGCFYLGSVIQGAAYAVVAVIVILSLFLMRSRYELARVLLVTVNNAAKEHWSVFWTVLLGLLVQGTFAIWNIFTFVAVFLRFEPWHKKCKEGDYCSATLTWILLAFVIVEYLWISGLISSVVLAVMAGGPYAFWWRVHDTKARSESIWALRRAAGTSLGSFAFGSLFVTIVEVIAFLIKLCVKVICCDGPLACLCNCCVNVLQSWIDTFNKYVYIRIGVSGFKVSYLGAARDIKELVQKDSDYAVAALLNDCVVTLALTVTCIGNAVLVAGVTYVYISVINTSLKIDEWWDWLIILYSFILALTVGLVLVSALEAGVSTIFVCLYEDPNCLENERHEALRTYLVEKGIHKKIMSEAAVNGGRQGV
ncbi:uncharacterized protein L203_102388 [Cryptococcus depauperatus CBS 7841]|uniref:Protein PNS1 n=1 Tax=Cryptococcus depauperatus CBS 7841 TaxID=1295531 RepID=A0AAJ8M124_9TREE